MLIRGVAMKEFMLHETSERSELRQVPAEKIHAMHHAKNAARFALSRKHGLKHLPRSFRVTKRARNSRKIARQEILQIWGEMQAMFLRQLKCPHHQLGFALKNLIV